MPPNLPKDILKLAVELIKHQAKKQLGDGFIDVLSKQLVDYAGNNALERVNEWLDSEENAEKLLAAFQDADNAFHDQGDDTFKQMIVSKPLSQLESLEKLARALPKTLNDDGLLEALRHQFEMDWSNLSSEVHEKASRAYHLHLERSLAIRCNQMLPSIFTKVERIEANTEKMLDGLGEILTKLDKLGSTKDSPQPSFIVPFPRNEKFVGREDDLEQLHNALMSGEIVGVRPAMLSGMGGVGKTQLAVEYVYKYRESYPGGIYWVNAAQNWTTELVHLAEGVGLRSDEDNESRRNTQLVNELVRFVKETPDTLVVFDNVKDPKQLKYPLGIFIPSELPRLLFTTRRRDTDLSFQSIDVRVLPEKIALELLLASKSRQPLLEKDDSDSEKSAARLICKDLGGSPLALALASAFLGKYSSVTLEGYRQRLQEEGLRAVDESGADPIDLPTRHDEAVTATLKSQWDVVESNTAKEVVFTASILGEAVQISYALLRLLLQFPDITKPGYPDPLETALNELSNLWLVEELTDEGLRLHPLVRDFALQTISEPDACARQASSNMAMSLEDIPRLEREIIRRGVDALLADIRIVRSLRQINNSLQDLERIVDNEAHNLRKWNPNDQPAYLIQQLHNRAFARNAKDWHSRLGKSLEHKKLPWFHERHPFSRVSFAFLRAFEGHTNSVNNVAITLDGRRAISVSNDNTLRLWDIESGAQLRIFEGHSDKVNSVAVTPDGRRAISASDDKTLRLWDLESGAQLRTFEGHSAKVNSVAVTPYGRRAISASDDKTLRLWDIESGVRLWIFEGHSSRVNSVAITPDGRCAISASSDKTLRLWGLKSGAQLRIFEGHLNGVNSVAVTPDGRRAISAASDDTLRLWDLESGQQLRTFEGHSELFLGVAVTPDGRRAISASYDKTLRLWDLESGAQLRTFEGHTEHVNSVAVTSDGRCAISASFDNTLRLWDLESGQQLSAREGHTDSIHSVAVTPDGRRAVSASNDDTLRLWDIESGQQLRAFEGHSYRVNSVAVTPDGRRAISASNDKTLRLWDIENGAQLRTLEGHSAAVNSVAVTPDGRRAISASDDDTLQLWDIESGAKLRTFEGHSSRVNSIAVTPDGRRAISASWDFTLRLWDLESGVQLRTFGRHDTVFNSVAVTPDGRRAISDSYDNTLRLWDIESGTQLRTFEGHSGQVNSVAVTPDGRRAISASYDNTLRLWDLESGKCLLMLASEAPILAATVSLDDKIIIAGDTQGIVHFIEIHFLK